MKLKILYVTQEIMPFLPDTEVSKMCRFLPQKIQERNREIRTFIPKFGSINERRHQLHEVIRLSGMNLVINDTDHPLIIKVASIQPARMQVYFIDNEDFFGRKFVFTDKNGKDFPDNDERAIFYSKGVVETVKKLGWAPDIVHCHGWFTAFFPYYLRKVYYNDPIFDHDFKIIYSFYNDRFKKTLDPQLPNKLIEGSVQQDDIKVLTEPTWQNVNRFAFQYSDAIIQGTQKPDEELMSEIENSGKPFLKYQSEENYVEKYDEFYTRLLENRLK